MIRRVVVPMDMTEEAGRAIPVAAALARLAGAELSALVVGSPHTDALHDVAEAQAFLETLGAGPMEVEVDQGGDVARAIAARAADLSTVVCMASHGRLPVAELLVGSVADDALRQGAGPLVLVGPHCEPGPELATLLVCVDGTAQASALIPTARRWIDELGLAPVVVQVVDTDATASPMGATRVAAELAASRTGGLAVRVEELHDSHPAGAIARLAADEKGPLIMVAAGTTGRLARLAHGSTTAALVRNASAPVVAVPVPSHRDTTGDGS